MTCEGVSFLPIYSLPPLGSAHSLQIKNKFLSRNNGIALSMKIKSAFLTSSDFIMLKIFPNSELIPVPKTMPCNKTKYTIVKLTGLSQTAPVI